MSDNQPAVEAATSDPAEVSKTEESVEVKSDEKAAAPADAEATTESKSEDKATNGATKNGDRYERDNRRGGRRFDDRRNGGGRFDRNKRARYNDEFDNLPETDDPVEIRAQVEFYFSTQNLSTDKHLFFELDGPKNRPISIKHLCQFKRMRRFQPYSAIVNAIRESKDLVVVDDGEYSGTGKEGVKLKEPLVAPKRDDDDKYPPTTDDLFHRMLKSSINKLENSIYAKGFAEDGVEVGQITLERFFKPYGAVMVRKRRAEGGAWKGSVFVEFDSEESQKQFLELDPKPKFEDKELTVMSKREYSEMKCKEKGIIPAWQRDEEYTSGRSGHREGSGRNGRGGRGDRGGRGGRGRGGRGGRGGRYNDRDRRGRDRSRSRSRGRRDRSGSRDSQDSRDWNRRRDRFQSSRDYKSDRRDRDSRRKSIERDAHGVPVVQDTRTEAEKADSKKRKGEDAERAPSPKKSKLQVKEDE